MIKPLILWGGTDINSKYYGENPSNFSQYPDHHRDVKEFYFAGQAIEDKIPVLGICRGAQLLCILNGGSLYQHSEPHKQNHTIECLLNNEDTFEKNTEIFDNVPASHHQIMKPKGNFIVYGWNPNTTRVWINNKESRIEKNCPEIVWWPETKSLAIQAHPEWADSGSTWIKYINNLLQELNIDFCFNNRKALSYK